MFFLEIDTVLAVDMYRLYRYIYIVSHSMFRGASRSPALFVGHCQNLFHFFLTPGTPNLMYGNVNYITGPQLHGIWCTNTRT